jgi:lantibiotic modifying enzyme
LLGRAADVAERTISTEPGPVTDFLGGAAGEGIFLIRLWEATRDARHLSGATRRAEWLREHVVRDDAGAYWPMLVGAERPARMLGFAHGAAGIAYFLLLLYEATREARWAELSREVAETFSKHAKPDRGGLNWPPVFGMSETPACQWCHGSPGIGLLFAKAYEVLGDEEYLETAKAAGETTFAYGDVRHNPSQCHGLAGNAELFVELYRLTHEAVWLERAHDFARRCLAYRTAAPEGDNWQADEPGFSSPDFMCGASGTGHFFLRLLAPDDVRLPLQ